MMDMSSDTPCPTTLTSLGRPAKHIGPKVCTLVYIAAVILGNITILYNVDPQQGWEALGIALVIGPLINAALMVIGLLAIPYLWMKAKYYIKTYVSMVISLSVAAAVIDLLIIFSMDLHGC